MHRQTRLLFSWVKNGLRHSFISYRLAILNDTARVALEAGNSAKVIFAPYRDLVTPEQAAGMVMREAR